MPGIMNHCIGELVLGSVILYLQIFVFGKFSIISLLVLSVSLVYSSRFVYKVDPYLARVIFLCVYFCYFHLVLQFPYLLGQFCFLAYFFLFCLISCAFWKWQTWLISYLLYFQFQNSLQTVQHMYSRGSCQSFRPQSFFLDVSSVFHNAIYRGFM